MTAEGTFPKADGDILYSSESNAVGIISIEAGENISADDVVYIKGNDGKAYISDTGATDDIRANGIALNTATIGNDVNVQTKGIFTTTGLTDKDEYFLGAAGAISATQSGVRIGIALSTTSLFINIVQDDRDTIGTVKAYLKSFTAIPSNNFTAFWVECNGQVLSDTESPLNTQTIPDLNGSSGTERFLRGQTTSGGTGGSETHTHSIPQNANNATGTDHGTSSGTPSGATSTLPSYYEVVWIIKIK